MPCAIIPLPLVNMFDLGTFFSHLVPFFSSLLGAICFVPLYAVWVACLLPGVWASMLAGALYGTWLGSLLVFFGASLGAEVAFLLARTILRDWFRKKLKRFPKFNAVETAVSEEGLKLILLTRLSPVFPFSLLNVAYGLSEVSFRDYSIGLIGILPGTVFFCSLGAFAGDLAKFGEILSGKGDLGEWLLRIFGIMATFGVAWIVGRSARSALQNFDH